MDRIPVYEKLSSVSQNQAELYKALREMPLDVVGDVLLYIPPEYESLRQALPSMASEQVQINWTGSSGHTLLMQSCAFVRSVESSYRKLTGRSLDDAKILDYGCGWGRLIRLMYKFTAPENIYGCDPWDKSIDTCQEHLVKAHLALSDYLPKEIPFTGVKFDLIYSFSVFTHLSDKAIKTALAACRKSISDDGIMVVTIRPKSYWDHHVDTQDKVDREKMKSLHDDIGFAHTAHVHRPLVDGERLYGDTSITLDYISREWKEWGIIGTDIFLQDPFQTLVFLKPVN
jgi:2-polyprenyl-3-methyl-5-hydroxy-6-metoxy-1,4-benzoquinol methylase